jgi:CheY-like chemotaxis protein
MDRPMDILLVEDNPADADLTRETLELGRFEVKLSVAVDGVEAMRELARRVEEGRALPDLILLDLNLPKKDGREILFEIKGEVPYQHIPVVVLTSSEADRDVVESYKLGASCYVAKPVDFSAFRKIVAAIEDFWFTVVRLPVRASPMTR